MGRPPWSHPGWGNPKVEELRTDEQETENMTPKPVLQERNNGLRLHLLNYSLVKLKGEKIFFVLGPKYISVEFFVVGTYSLGFPGDSMVENPPVSAGDSSSVPGSEDPLEKVIASHSSILAWKIPWTEGA